MMVFQSQTVSLFALKAVEDPVRSRWLDTLRLPLVPQESKRLGGMKGRQM
jgi:hypothetical protein